MITAKTAADKVKAMTNAAAEQIGNISTTEKIAGAAVLGAVVGAAATALGSSLLHSDAAPNKPTAAKKPVA